MINLAAAPSAYTYALNPRGNFTGVDPIDFKMSKGAQIDISQPAPVENKYPKTSYADYVRGVQNQSYIQSLLRKEQEERKNLASQPPLQPTQNKNALSRQTSGDKFQDVRVLPPSRNGSRSSSPVRIITAATPISQVKTTTASVSQSAPTPPSYDEAVQNLKKLKNMQAKNRQKAQEAQQKQERRTAGEIFKEAKQKQKQRQQQRQQQPQDETGGYWDWLYGSAAVGSLVPVPKGQDPLSLVRDKEKEKNKNIGQQQNMGIGSSRGMRDLDPDLYDEEYPQDQELSNVNKAQQRYVPPRPQDSFMSRLKRYSPQEWVTVLIALTFVILALIAVIALHKDDIDIDLARNAFNGMMAISMIAIGYGIGRHVTDQGVKLTLTSEDFILFLVSIAIAASAIIGAGALNNRIPDIGVAKDAVRYAGSIAGIGAVISFLLKKGKERGFVRDDIRRKSLVNNQNRANYDDDEVDEEEEIDFEAEDY